MELNARILRNLISKEWWRTEPHVENPNWSEPEL